MFPVALFVAAMGHRHRQSRRFSPRGFVESEFHLRGVFQPVDGELLRELTVYVDKRYPGCKLDLLESNPAKELRFTISNGGVQRVGTWGFSRADGMREFVRQVQLAVEEICVGFERRNRSEPINT